MNKSQSRFEHMIQSSQARNFNTISYDDIQPNPLIQTFQSLTCDAVSIKRISLDVLKSLKLKLDFGMSVLYYHQIDLHK